MKKAFIISLMDDLIQQLERVERKTDVLLKRSILNGDGPLTADEVAEILAISPQQLFGLIEDGQIEFVGGGEILGFSLENLQNFLEENDTYPPTNMEDES